MQFKENVNRCHMLPDIAISLKVEISDIWHLQGKTHYPPPQVHICGSTPLTRAPLALDSIALILIPHLRSQCQPTPYRNNPLPSLFLIIRRCRIANQSHQDACRQLHSLIKILLNGSMDGSHISRRELPSCGVQPLECLNTHNPSRKGINRRSGISKGEIFQGVALKLFAVSCSIWEL